MIWPGWAVVPLLRAEPRVTLKSVVDISSLTYVCTQRKDGAEGTCKIRQLPAEAGSIQRWLAT